jgi:hypothetical protein
VDAPAALSRLVNGVFPHGQHEDRVCLLPARLGLLIYRGTLVIPLSALAALPFYRIYLVTTGIYSPSSTLWAPYLDYLHRANYTDFGAGVTDQIARYNPAFHK